MSGLMFAGDRSIAVRALEHLIEVGDAPAVLAVGGTDGTTHADELRSLATAANPDVEVFVGRELFEHDTRAHLRERHLDLSLSVHFPHVVPESALGVPRQGWVNLHPSLLPHNRGMAPNLWAIREGSPAGVTLHRMVERLDAGAVLAQLPVPIAPDDTGASLYDKLANAELALLVEHWPALRDGLLDDHFPDDPGSYHDAESTLAAARLDPDAPKTTAELIDILRAHTTSRPTDAAWFEADGHRWAVRVEITDLGPTD